MEAGKIVCRCGAAWKIREGIPEFGDRPVSGGSAGHLQVVETDFAKDPRWNPFVKGHPQGSIFHHSLWLNALKTEFGQETLSLACVDSNGDFQGILPLFYTRGLPLGISHIGGQATGCRLTSLPRTPLAGPLGDSREASELLVLEAMRRVRSRPGVTLQLKASNNELDGLVDDVVCTPWRLSYMLELSASSEGSFRIANSSNRYNIKKAINKATRLGVYVRPAETPAELHEWYTLYLDTMRRNAVPARPYRFFAALWDPLRSRGVMQLLLAEQQNAGRSRILAGTIFLRLGRTMFCAFNGSQLSDLSLRPNDLIYWTAINDACRSGFEFFDFGEVEEGNSDLARYKSKWGSKPVRLYRYYYPAGPYLESGSVAHGGYSELLRKAAWRRLPLRATAWLGDRIYARL